MSLNDLFYRSRAPIGRIQTAGKLKNINTEKTDARTYLRDIRNAAAHLIEARRHKERPASQVGARAPEGA